MDATSSEKAQTVVIPGISGPQQQRLLDVLIQQADVDAIWLFGSRAMGRENPGSEIDLCIDAARLSHLERLRMMPGSPRRLSIAGQRCCIRIRNLSPSLSWIRVGWPDCLFGFCRKSLNPMCCLCAEASA